MCNAWGMSKPLVPCVQLSTPEHTHLKILCMIIGGRIEELASPATDDTRPPLGKY